MVRQWSVATFVACLGIGACSGRSEAPPAPAADAAPEARTPTVFDDPLKALDKAKAVQATLDQADADRRKALDDAGG
ncbi:MAG: hypothetical protein J0L88_13950 [Xanthomonadales bacterium]|nr:hypothetical protein [Xanthomonadales bacterium]